jgi:hypothetical protein
MGIISVRISSDIPIQSEYLPLISLFFFLSLLFTFISFNWFVIVNSFRTNNSIPFVLKIFSKNIESIYTRVLSKINRVSPACQSESSNDEIENLIKILNYFTFTLMFLLMFISYLVIWLTIA